MYYKYYRDLNIILQRARVRARVLDAEDGVSKKSFVIYGNKPGQAAGMETTYLYMPWDNNVRIS
jgi:hypothetical protein